MSATPDTGPVWRCGQRELSLVRPLVMGVLNATPDSFSDGGAHEDPLSAVAWGERLAEQGADIIDVGGESTRPGSDEVPVSEELARVRPVVMRLAGELSIPVSVDTRHAQVAAACVEAGACIINDISGFTDPEMVQVAASTSAGCVIMHMRGEPKTMQAEPVYDDVVREVAGFLLAQAALLQSAGVERERIALDPGIGFGKTLAHNMALLRAIPAFVELGYPVLIGVSRKHFIGEITGEQTARDRVGGSVAAALYSARAGAHVVRVHDVRDTVQALAVDAALSRD